HHKRCRVVRDAAVQAEKEIRRGTAAKHARNTPSLSLAPRKSIWSQSL
ncbi:hypothetical protein E5Q_06645, partial [Mixia osmundae IAM 14324]